MHIVENPQAAQALDEARLKWRNAGRAWDHLTFAVMMRPEDGYPLDEAGSLRFVESLGVRGLAYPTIRMIYAWDGETLTIQTVEFSDSKNPRAGSA